MLEYYKEILNYVSKLVGDKESAKDIAQETFVRVCIRRNNSDSQPIYIRTLCRS
ncbi:hypothetical protein N3114_11410 [Aliarcobacter butzleri]|nr:hypothetical protein N3114_11410 [Aliarcobacter butzleri]